MGMEVGVNVLRTASVSESEASTALRPSAIDNPRLSRFPRVFYSFEELEPSVEQAIVGRLERDESLRQIIVAPRQRLLDARKAQRWHSFFLPWVWTPDWVLALTNHRMLVATIDHPQTTPLVTSIRAQDILSFEWGAILLHSWIEWAQASQDQVERTRVYFNSVGQSLFKRVLDSQRHDLAAQTGRVAERQDRHLAHLAKLPFKFLNLITTELLLPDEQVQTVVFQPAVWTRQRGILRRQKAAALAVVLSSYHILVAQEELTGRPDSWGLVTHFYPLDRIQQVILKQEQDTLWLNLVMEVQGTQQQAHIRFEPDAQTALQELLTLL
jgi:hypothetical protein